ncbi:MAG: cysteine peptidase family C39 domain-containing protein [Patescibacteria group bacterium]
MKKRANVEYFFRQNDSKSCGVCVVNTILKMFGLPGAIFSVNAKRGTSPKRILQELRKAGLVAVSKTISIRNLKPRSILWYPFPRDHYVVVGDIADGKALIYDSERKEPYWCHLSILKKKWYGGGGKSHGWVIEVTKPTGEK